MTDSKRSRKIQSDRQESQSETSKVPRSPKAGAKKRTNSAPAVPYGTQSRQASTDSQNQSLPRDPTLRSIDRTWEPRTTPEAPPGNVSQDERHSLGTGFAPNAQVNKLQDIALAVVGTPRSGKSTFVQHALDLKKPPASAVSTKKVSLEGVVSVLRMYEYDMNDVSFTPDGSPRLPIQPEEGSPCRVDGILVMCNVNSVSSTEHISTMLRKPSLHRSLGHPNVSQNVGTPASNPASISETMKVKDLHERTQSEYPHRPGQTTCNDEDDGLMNKLGNQQSKSGNRSMASAKHDNGTVMPLQTNDAITAEESRRTDGKKVPGRADIPRGDESPSSHAQEDGSNLATAISHSAGSKHQLTNPPQAQSDISTNLKKVDDIVDGGVDFGILVDRLMSQAISKVDVKFTGIFLCLYRKFAAPSSLLTASISRFDKIGSRCGTANDGSTCQLRCLGVLATWITQYPGDFAHPLTRSMMADLVTRLISQRPFARIVNEIAVHLDQISEDDDTYWACSDMTGSIPSIVPHIPPIAPSRYISVSPDSFQPGQGTTDFGSGTDTMYESSKGSTDSTTTSSVDQLSVRSTKSAQAILECINNAQNGPSPSARSSQHGLSKVHWHRFMNLSDDDIAREMTRIDWVMFSSIKPRDLVRHASLSDKEKKQYKGLRNVGRMIRHFNYIAFWVANMIIMRDKAKHRAKTLEKCIGIAWKLRHLNNYNSLGAVVAGVNSTAIHRLHQTRELVSYDLQKQFMRLEILMGTQKSHFAYRLAWSNTSTECIPFLPLHSRDLAVAEEVNPTFFGEHQSRINWKKFEVIGEVILGIQRNQALPYTSIAAHEEAQRLILETRFEQDEDVATQPTGDVSLQLTQALKFLPNCQILPQGLSSPFIEYLNPRSTLAPPHPSPLAARLFNVDGINAVFYGPDFITITKAADTNWAHVKPEVFSLITEAVSSGERIVSAAEKSSSGTGESQNTLDSLAYDEKDSEVVGMIKELLETRIRPAIQDDGGDVEYCGFEDGKVMLKLRGACRTCDSSTIEEVQGITQVLDEAELTSDAEFARFEERLKERRGHDSATDRT
ncbi:MAG: hypothetical protein Q9220_005107 [cf. Caloplaca sp. 1 TL-2023]